MLRSSAKEGYDGDRQCLFAVAKEEECREECDDDAKNDAPDITHEARRQLSGLAGCPLRGISDHFVEVDTQSSGLAVCLGDELLHRRRTDRAGENHSFHERCPSRRRMPAR